MNHLFFLSYTDNSQLYFSLFQEISLLSRLEHENIVQYFGTDKVLTSLVWLCSSFSEYLLQFTSIHSFCIFCCIIIFSPCGDCSIVVGLMLFLSHAISKYSCPSWTFFNVTFGGMNITQEGGKLYIFLELVTQGSLAALYQRYRLQDSQVSAYTRQILNGLLYLHQRNVLHRWELACYINLSLSTLYSFLFLSIYV